MRHVIFLAVLLSCFNSYGASLSVDQLFRETEIRQFRLSPGGDLLSIWRYFEERDEVIITDPKSEKGYTVFKIDESDKTGVTWTGWIDADSLVVKYYDFHGLPHYMILDVSKSKDGSLVLNKKDVLLRGLIVDVLPDEQDIVDPENETGC